MVYKQIIISRKVCKITTMAQWNDRKSNEGHQSVFSTNDLFSKKKKPSLISENRMRLQTKGLQNLQFDFFSGTLDDKLTHTECYCHKDTFLITNPPIDAKNYEKLVKNILKMFKSNLRDVHVTEPMTKGLVYLKVIIYHLRDVWGTKMHAHVRFVLSFFCMKCLLNFNCQLKLIKLKGTR